ncbi:hypothetical protein [Nannocystis pusilla]|uniref:hypothetical protein n=1 Tax=Nannocystis pusilla TaxID=889268 RepID=UPI003B7E452A
MAERVEPAHQHVVAQAGDHPHGVGRGGRERELQADRQGVRCDMSRERLDQAGDVGRAGAEVVGEVEGDDARARGPIEVEAGIARLARITGVAGIAGLTRVAGVAGVTRIAGLAGIARLPGLAGLAGLARFAGLARLAGLAVGAGGVGRSGGVVAARGRDDEAEPQSRVGEAEREASARHRGLLPSSERRRGDANART